MQVIEEDNEHLVFILAHS